MVFQHLVYNEKKDVLLSSFSNDKENNLLTLLNVESIK